MESLTFGVEFEFVVVHQRTAFDELQPNEDHSEFHVDAKDAILECLTKHHIPASFAASATYNHWQIHSDHHRLSRNERTELPNTHVQNAVEISSRKMRISEGWQQEVRQVLAVLRWMRGQFKFEFITNDMTGLHVHMGDLRGISLITAKRMVQVCSVHERNLDRLHDTNRIMNLKADPSGIALNWSVPLYANLSLFHDTNDSNNDNILDCVEDVEGQQAFKTLADLFWVLYQCKPTNGHSSTLNLDNLYPDRNISRFDPSPAVPKGTIEFRQHAGDLDETEVISYIILLAHLTTFCKTASNAEFVDLLVRGMNTTFGLRNLLEAINCDAGVVTHFCNRRPGRSNHTPAPALQRLMDINHQESSARKDQQAVEAKIESKIQSGLYKMNFNAANNGNIPISVAGLTWMLDCARRDSGPAASESKVLQIVFRKLANIYQKLNADDADEESVMDFEFSTWMTAYGSPSETQ